MNTSFLGSVARSNFFHIITSTIEHLCIVAIPIAATAVR